MPWVHIPVQRPFVRAPGKSKRRVLKDITHHREAWHWKCGQPSSQPLPGFPFSLSPPWEPGRASWIWGFGALPSLMEINQLDSLSMLLSFIRWAVLPEYQPNNLTVNMHTLFPITNTMQLKTQASEKVKSHKGMGTTFMTNYHAPPIILSKAFSLFPFIKRCFFSFYFLEILRD
jgi:hypothetical protein